MNKVKGKIGPHEEIEFKLFKVKKKNVILFDSDCPPENHQKMADELGAKALVFERPDLNLTN